MLALQGTWRGRLPCLAPPIWHRFVTLRDGTQCSNNSQAGVSIPSVQDAALNQGRRIADREDDYRKRRLARMISPARNDAFAMGDQTPDARVSTYADRMRESQLARERDNTLQVCCASLPVAACQPAHTPCTLMCPSVTWCLPLSGALHMCR
jgi:hypothetical protein